MVNKTWTEKRTATKKVVDKPKQNTRKVVYGLVPVSLIRNRTTSIKYYFCACVLSL